ncbi:MAG: hypothetical protein ABIF12_02850 [bacterium]
MKNFIVPPRFFKNLKNWGWVLKGSLFYSFLFFMSLKPLTSNQILALAKESFNLTLPGFEYERLFKLGRTAKKKMLGRFFELETAVCLKEFYNENIIGFNLDINISDTLNNQEVEVMIPGSIAALRTTEYDVVTNGYVIECKSGSFKARENRIYQFLKERNLIEWFKTLKEEIISGSLSSRIELNRKGKRVLILNGISTMGKDIRLMSSWFKYFKSMDYYDFWTEIIDLLSNKRLCLIFKTIISYQSKEFLEQEGFKFEDNFHYRRLSGLN